MNSTSIKEAVAVGYPRDKMYGVWWSGAEPDVRPAEGGATGYNAVTLQHTAGQFQLHEDLKKHVYDKGQGSAKWEETGEILYVRGLINAMLGVEAIRTAQKRFGNKPMTGEQVRWGLENLDITAARITAARLRRRAEADQGVLRRPRGRAHRPHPDLGRQELEDHLGLVRVRRQGDRADGQGRRGEIRGGEEDRAGLPDQLMAAPVDHGRNSQEAAATPPPSALAATSAATILAVNNIEVVYNHVILVLKGVSLDVPKGGIVALLGANGAGKTTTLKAISNLLHAERGEVTKGSIVFEGDEVHSLTPNELVRRGCIQVMEGRRCFAHLTVEENLLTGAYTRKDGQAAIKRDLDLVYSYFPRIKERRNATAGYTSGGEQQMCAVGRALMSRPKMILLDEPSMGLAPQIVEEIFEIVKNLNEKEGVSFLLAEQNTNMALKYARYGYILENGRVVMDGEAKALRENEDVKEFYLGIAEGKRKSFRNVKHYKRRKRWLA